jgi:hypothetical protein
MSKPDLHRETIRASLRVIATAEPRPVAAPRKRPEIAHVYASIMPAHDVIACGGLARPGGDTSGTR